VSAAAIGGAMGTLMLLRQIGATIALAAAATVYAAGTAHAGGTAPAATANGHAVFAVTLAGTVVAAGALVALPRGTGRLPAPPGAVAVAV
jgi:hypothetical protein